MFEKKPRDNTAQRRKEENYRLLFLKTSRISFWLLSDNTTEPDAVPIPNNANPVGAVALDRVSIVAGSPEDQTSIPPTIIKTIAEADRMIVIITSIISRYDI
jgi:hypothetical protein